jgi:hypothetical protein
MSDEIKLAPAAPIPDQTAPAAALTTVPDRDLVQLTIGFLCLFWGLGGIALAGVESLVTPALRPLPVLILVGSALALILGAWRLRHVTTLGEEWRKRTRDLWIATSLTGYLSLFFILWRQVPVNPYLLGHAVAFVAGMLVLLCLLCLPVAVLARAAGRSGVAVQAVTCGTAAVVMLLPPFGLVTQALALALRQGRDPVAVIQFWLERVPWWLPLVGLLPVAMTASLLWSAQDLAWGLWEDRQRPEASR